MPVPSRPWFPPPPGRVVGRGHPAGDILRAHDWALLEQREGYLRVRADLPEAVRNPRGQLFGGFTPAYVDLISLLAARAGGETPDPRREWMATTSMRVDYFEPIVGPTFEIEAEVEKRRGRSIFVVTRFLQGDALAAYAVTTLRQVALDRPLGDA